MPGNEMPSPDGEYGEVAASARGSTPLDGVRSREQPWPIPRPPATVNRFVPLLRVAGLIGLASNHHDFDLLDLCAEGFDPVLREGEWLDCINDPKTSVTGVMAGHAVRKHLWRSRHAIETSTLAQRERFQSRVEPQFSAIQ